jgi:hypothetical protein
MNESKSRLLNSAAKTSHHRRIAGKLAAGFGIASLVLVAHVEIAGAQEKSEADRKIEAAIPLPEPANVPPLTASDITPRKARRRPPLRRHPHSRQAHRQRTPLRNSPPRKSRS